jgi:predicted nuclease of predicted toxin-antitoxin system
LKLRLLLDQNIPRGLVGTVRSLRPGWEIRHVGDVGLWGATDRKVLEWAQRDGSIVLTFDEDFADARMFPVGSHPGVIRLRVWPTTAEKAGQAMIRLLDAVSDNDLRGSLVIVTNNRIRLRRAITHG